MGLNNYITAVRNQLLIFGAPINAFDMPPPALLDVTCVGASHTAFCQSCSPFLRSQIRFFSAETKRILGSARYFGIPLTANEIIERIQAVELVVVVVVVLVPLRCIWLMECMLALHFETSPIPPGIWEARAGETRKKFA